MDWVIRLVPVLFSTTVAGLFTVEVDKQLYKSEFRGDVVMGCSFQPPSPAALSGIRVTWHWFSPDGQVREVYRLNNGEQNRTSQHPDYVGRARLLDEELKRGQAKLQVSNLKISDSGKYQCFVQTKDGADYKIVTLSVFAPFKKIHRQIEKVPGREEVALTCRSRGYPRPEVTWLSGWQELKSKPVTTTAKTEDQLFEITTQINVTSLGHRNYTCIFTDRAATFDIPGDIPAQTEKNMTMIVVLSLSLTLGLTVVVFVLYRCRHKVFRSASTRNLIPEVLVRGLVLPAGKGMKEEATNEEEKNCIHPTINNGCLKALLKDHYLKCIHWDTEKPLPALRDNDDQELTIHHLVPANGDTLLLVEPTGSRRMAVARALVSAWTQEPVLSPPDLSAPNLSHLQLVVCVDGGDAKDRLLDEAIAQLSLEEALTPDELRNALTDEALLIVDGYREGNAAFDESLQRFLSDRRGCRVLITAGLEPPRLREMIGRGAIVRLQQR